MHCIKSIIMSIHVLHYANVNVNTHKQIESTRKSHLIIQTNSVRNKSNIKTALVHAKANSISTSTMYRVLACSLLFMCVCKGKQCKLTVKFPLQNFMTSCVYMSNVHVLNTCPSSQSIWTEPKFCALWSFEHWAIKKFTDLDFIHLTFNWLF